MTSNVSECSLNVVDVYDQASTIGKCFEKIISQHGAGIVEELMPKVIHVFELLEVHADRREVENEQLAVLRETVQSLQVEKSNWKAEKKKYEQELEHIDETWRSEQHELMGNLRKVREENDKLRDTVTERFSKEVRIKSTAEEELVLLEKLKTTIDKQRVIIRNQERDLSETRASLGAVQSQLSRFTRQNEELRRKNHSVSLQAKTLIEERVDVDVKLQEREHDLGVLKAKLAQCEVVAMDAEDVSCASRHESEADSEPTTPIALHLPDKMVIDLNDPNRPRFTLQELKDVLHDRNNLKQQVFELKDQIDSLLKSQPKSKVEVEEAAPEIYSFDSPVYGPLPEEPQEKLYPWMKEESGIRKLFRRVFSPQASRSKSFKGHE